MNSFWQQRFSLINCYCACADLEAVSCALARALNHFKGRPRHFSVSLAFFFLLNLRWWLCRNFSVLTDHCSSRSFRPTAYLVLLTWVQIDSFILVRFGFCSNGVSSPEMTALRPAMALRRLPLHLLPNEWQSSGLARTSSPSTMKEGRQKGKRPFWHAQRDAELRTPHCASLSQRPTRLALCSCWACRVKTNLAPFSHHHGNLEHAHKSHKCKKKKKKSNGELRAQNLAANEGERRRKTRGRWWRKSVVAG